MKRSGKSANVKVDKELNNVLNHVQYIVAKSKTSWVYKNIIVFVIIKNILHLCIFINTKLISVNDAQFMLDHELHNTFYANLR